MGGHRKPGEAAQDNERFTYDIHPVPLANTAECITEWGEQLSCQEKISLWNQAAIFFTEEHLNCFVKNGDKILCQVHDDLARAGMVPVLPQVDALPGSQQQFAPLEWHADLGCSQGGLDMRGHVVRPLQSVRIKRVILRNQSIQPALQVKPGAVVIVFLYQQTGGCVPDKQCAQPFPHATGGHHGCDVACNGVQTLAAHCDGYTFDHKGMFALRMGYDNGPHGKHRVSTRCSQ